MVKKSMEFYDKKTSFFIADPENIPLSYLPSPESVREAAEELILSASGWRKVFAENGDEESFTDICRPEDIVIASTAALAVGELFKEFCGKAVPAVALAIDTRPTGPALADAAARSLISQGIAVRYLFISPAPEIMAYVKTTELLHGFFYITGSHNPVGHNGFKFGLGDGAVAGGESSRRTIERFKTLLGDDKVVEKTHDALRRGTGESYTRVLENLGSYKAEAMAAYEEFTLRVAAGGSAPRELDDFSRRFRAALAKKPIGILGELNGSARCSTIDDSFLSKFGVEYSSLNSAPRRIVHPIVPEGKSLDMCGDYLQQLHKEHPSYILGYVPDNDGDRGNIVYYDSREETSHAMQAQEVFALSVLSELADLRSRVDPEGKAAVVINGPTSMRIERIAELFRVEVFRTETGEANVVTKAEELRYEGYAVRILGEGSNGGNITYPATVRDPLNTIISLLKLLTIPDIYSLWYSLGGEKRALPASGPKEVTLREVMDSLPPFLTTGAYEPEAKMKVSTTDHGLLKQRYEDLFVQEWEERKQELKSRFGIHSWRELQYEGTESREGVGPDFRSGTQSGGLKIVFSNHSGKDTDFIWMRGSGTEPVFRVIADCEGKDKARHDYLLGWHRSIIERADAHAHD